MSRMVLKASERRDQILDTAQELFIGKGFRATTMQDILDRAGIARGTLYYHFAGKDQILTAMIDRAVAQTVAQAQAIADGDADPITKFFQVIGGAQMTGANQDLIEDLHAPGNAQFHLQSNVSMVRGLAPVLTQIVTEGVAAGVFTTPQPREDVEILLIAGGMLTDEGIFTGDAAERPRRLLGLIGAAERLLGCAPGALLGLLEGR